MCQSAGMSLECRGRVAGRARTGDDLDDLPDFKLELRLTC